MKSSLLFGALLAFASSCAAADDKKKTPPLNPCTIRSPAGNFFDLRPLTRETPKSDAKTKDTTPVKSWTAIGHDYGANFTLNICGPVVEELHDVEGVDKDLYKNISAYYIKDRNTYSIGSERSELVFRGRKLVLNYTHGSPCGLRSRKRSVLTDLRARKDEEVNHGKGGDKKNDDKKDDHKDAPKEIPSDGKRRKSTIISFLCDQEPLDPKADKVAFSFVGTDEDECVYIFEARSHYACAALEATPQQLGPGGVFGVIMLIALIVYLVGGIAYQRTVMHQRGWKQLPNYSMWAGLFGFLMDMFIIMTSSCARFLPGRRGYSRVSLNGNSRGRGVHTPPDDENRLIDQLDDEWDD